VPVPVETLVAAVSKVFELVVGAVPRNPGVFSPVVSVVAVRAQVVVDAAVPGVAAAPGVQGLVVGAVVVEVGLGGAGGVVEAVVVSEAMVVYAARMWLVVLV